MKLELHSLHLHNNASSLSTEQCAYGSVPFIECAGPVIYVNSVGLLVLDNCVIRDTRSSHFGALTFYRSAAQITNSTFTRLQAARGAAVFALESNDDFPVTIASSVFESNEATDFGSAVASRECFCFSRVRGSA